MPTEAQLQKRAMREALYQRQGVSILNLAADKRPGAYLQAQDLTARRAAAKARVTSGVLTPGAALPDGTKCPIKQAAFYGCWIAVDGGYTAQRREAWDTQEKADAARAAWETQAVKDLLTADLIEDYLDFATGI